jgi:hypothetical protein
MQVQLPTCLTRSLFGFSMSELQISRIRLVVILDNVWRTPDQSRRPAKMSASNALRDHAGECLSGDGSGALGGGGGGYCALGGGGGP